MGRLLPGEEKSLGIPENFSHNCRVTFMFVYYVSFWANTWYLRWICFAKLNWKASLDSLGQRDDPETRLAGINAAIEQIERQLSREDTAA